MKRILLEVSGSANSESGNSSVILFTADLRLSTYDYRLTTADLRLPTSYYFSLFLRGKKYVNFISNEIGCIFFSPKYTLYPNPVCKVVLFPKQYPK
jgi:hypothetical protein